MTEAVAIKNKIKVMTKAMAMKNQLYNRGNGHEKSTL